MKLGKVLLMLTSLVTIASCSPDVPPDEPVEPTPHVCEKPRLDIYILSGQSNMVGYSPIADLPAVERNKVYTNGWYYVSGEGESSQPTNFNCWKEQLKAGMYGYTSNHFGPEVGFSKYMEDKYGATIENHENMVMLKYSQGGSAMYDRWFSSTISEKGHGYQLAMDAAGRVLNDATLDGKVVGDLYCNLVTLVREVIDRYKNNFCVHIMGLIWNQGCHDGVHSHMANLYEENLTDFIKDFRRDIDAPDMPVVLGQIKTSISGCPYAYQVAQAQAKVAGDMDYVDYIDTTNFDTLGPGDPHFSASSMLSLGKKEAETLYKYRLESEANE